MRDIALNSSVGDDKKKGIAQLNWAIPLKTSHHHLTLLVYVPPRQD